MKKLLFLSVIIAALVSSCGNKQDKETTDNDEIYTGPTTEEELRVALANQDSLLSILNDITDDMAAIREMEGLLAATDETSVRKQIHQDMLAIQQTLQQRKQKIEELEKLLANSRSGNAVLQKTIDNLKQQIEEQEQLIEGYKEEIEQNKIRIQQQDEEIASLNTTVTEVTEAKNQAEEQNVSLTNEINTCYYVVGTNKELKNNGILSKKNIFSRTKVLPGDVDTQFFIKADKRTLVDINCHSKKAEVKTNQPKSSYEFIEEANGDKILVIKDPNEFWKKSDFLVIEIK